VTEVRAASEVVRHDDLPTPPEVSEARDRPSSRGWRERALDAAVVFGLMGVALTQPLLDLFGRNPTFFVAGGYGRRQIVAFAMVIAFVPGLTVWAVTTLPGLAHRTVGSLIHRVRVAALAGLFALVLARSLGLDGLLMALLFAAVVGVAVAFAEGRWRPVRQFLSYLALSNVVFLALFLFGSPTTELLRGASYADAGNVMVPQLEGPVTVIVLDEFPLASIVRPDGTINEVRYPNLAALAGESTWFRNAASESAFTAYSVPSILSGTLAGRPDLPILKDFPRNYFSLFGLSYPVHRFEAITDLCPPDACGRPPAQPLSQALDDAKLVYQHRVLPERWREGLPAVDHAWGQFGDDEGDASAVEDAGSAGSASLPGPNDLLREIPEEDKGPVAQRNVLLRQTLLIDATPSINFTHVLVPHLPHVLTPWGTVGIKAEDIGELPPPGEPGYERHVAENLALQAMQIGAVDQTIGEVISHLKAVGAWESGTFVLLSDHGRFSSVPGNGRDYSEEVQDELLRIPLFIKAPGQTSGEVRDDPASTLDVLPSLIDLLGIEAEWEFDGHSLFDGSDPTHDRRLTSDLDGLFAVAEWQESLHPHGDDWGDLAAIGEHGDLVGTSVSDHEVGEPSDLSWSLDDRASLDDPSLTNGAVPVRLTGTITGADDEPNDLVVAIDGTIAGTIGARDGHGDTWDFTGILGPPGARGQGEQVTAYEVEVTGDRTVLHQVAAV
jgi:hypothetical protein